MKKLIAKKVNMTQIFGETGEVYPVTVVMPVEKGQTLSTDSQGLTLDTGDDFQEGEMVNVSGTSKGKGFQGVVKRHKFEGGRRSHGQKHSEREAGSIGGGGRAGGRVIKGMRMAGRMGNERVTVKNLKIIKILPETREIFIQGAIPGRRGSTVEIKAR
ncbi:MAG: 50S ribosomal protein L3 [bacterium]|nr:50S ribosomal protein L3 [bacterium]